MHPATKLQRTNSLKSQTGANKKSSKKPSIRARKRPGVEPSKGRAVVDFEKVTQANVSRPIFRGRGLKKRPIMRAH
jgi:hypothetical protein